jgi:transglutaminase/protease-like cytokinesis protein 3
MDVNGRQAEFTLEQIVQRERGVCMEYSVLFWFLADSVGLDTYLICDYTIPNGGGHAYNMVVINGTGYIIDTTWDSGNVSGRGGNTTFQRRFEKNYFMPSIALSYMRRGW